MLHKETKKRFEHIHYIEDTGESGHSWIHMEPDSNETITSHAGQASIALEEAGPLFARMRVTYRMMIPSGIEPEMTGEYREAVMNHVARSKDYKEMIVVSRFTLRAGSARLDVKTTLENPARNHRVRVIFPTRLAAETTESEAGFDVISRDIHVKKDSSYFNRPNPQYPMFRFVDMCDKKAGFALLNNCGMREFEAMDMKDRPLALTLFRAYTYRNCPIFGRYEVYPEMELSQMPGRYEWSYAIYPHSGDWTNGVFAQAEDFNLPLEPAQVGPHAGDLPKAMSFMEVTGGQLQLTAFKQAEDRPENFVVRVFNPTEKAVSGSLKLWKAVNGAWLTNLNEEREKEIKCSGKTIPIKAGKKKIVTIEFSLKA
jgi:alpha-mannosidase